MRGPREHGVPGGADAPSAGITWRWSFFLLGAVYALPAVIVALFHPVAGLALAVGVMPVAAFNLPGQRRGRRVIPTVGALSGASIAVGSLLTQLPWVAVPVLFLLGLALPWWARRSRLGALALVLCFPLVGIGLSFWSLPLALAVAGLIVLGSVYAYAVAMLWPEHQLPPPSAERPDRLDTAIYGVLLGGAAAVAAAVGYGLRVEHVGWIVGSALLVMRPVRDQLVLRSIGRGTSVIVGAVAAAAFAALDPAEAVTAVVVGLVLAAMSATQRSRWYVTPGFTSFIVLTLLCVTTDVAPRLRLAERVLETLIGVAVALLFGAAIPALIRLRRRGRTDPAAPAASTSPTETSTENRSDIP